MLRRSAGLLQPHLASPGPPELPAAAHYLPQMYHPAYSSYMQQLQLHEQMQHLQQQQQRAAVLPPLAGYAAAAAAHLPPKKEHPVEEEGRATPAAPAPAAADQYGVSAAWMAGYHEQTPAPFSLESPCSRDIVELQRWVSLGAMERGIRVLCGVWCVS